MAEQFKLGIKGYSKSSFDKFAQQFGSLASATKRVDPEEEFTFDRKKLRTVTSKGLKEFGGSYNYRTKKATFKDEESKRGYLAKYEDFVEGGSPDDLVKAFRLRQDEVFGRRARPGVISQTRLV